MKISEIFIIAVGLSMDAFAVSICQGLSMKKATTKSSLIIGGYFGVFQGLMPLIGYFLGSLFAEKIQAFDHWLAFFILGVLGVKMIYDGIKGYNEVGCEEGDVEPNLDFKVMIPFAIGTSIDALAAGISFSLLQINIFQAVLLIGLTTFILSVIGVKIGNKVGEKVKSFSEILGGIILISMGLKILIEHTTI